MTPRTAPQFGDVRIYSGGNARALEEQGPPRCDCYKGQPFRRRTLPLTARRAALRPALPLSELIKGIRPWGNCGRSPLDCLAAGKYTERIVTDLWDLPTAGAWPRTRGNGLCPRTPGARSLPQGNIRTCRGIRPPGKDRRPGRDEKLRLPVLVHRKPPGILKNVRQMVWMNVPIARMAVMPILPREPDIFPEDLLETPETAD